MDLVVTGLRSAFPLLQIHQFRCFIFAQTTAIIPVQVIHTSLSNAILAPAISDGLLNQIVGTKRIQQWK